MSVKHKRASGFTLIEMMFTIIISTIIVTLGILYARSLYRGHLVNDGEQLMLQIINAAAHYSTPANANQSLKVNTLPTGRYNGISTTWVANTGQIPSRYVQLDADGKTLSILTPWNHEADAVDITSGSLSSCDQENTPVAEQSGAEGTDRALVINIYHLPLYACQSLATRLQQILGGRTNTLATKTGCDDTVPDDSTLCIATNPSLY